MIAANQTHLQSLGSIDFSVSVQGLTTPYTFKILKDLGLKIICGLDFFNDKYTEICCRQAIEQTTSINTKPLAHQENRTVQLKVHKYSLSTSHERCY